MSEDAEEWLQTHKPLLDGFLQDLKDVQGAESLISARGTYLFSSRGPRRRHRHIYWDTFHHALLSW